MKLNTQYSPKEKILWALNSEAVCNFFLDQNR